jgi:peptidoglycan/LPS O-acetylase OafA/YrhL
LGRVELGGWHPDTILSVINQSTVVLANVVPVPVLAVAWTLALEEQIYALYSAMMAKVRRIRPLRLLVCAAAAAVLWRLGSSVLTDSFPNARAMPGLAYTASGHVLYQQVPSRAFEWVLGLVLAEIYVGRIRAVGVVGRLPLALVGIAAAATLWQKPVGLVTVADHPFYMSDVIVDPLFGVGYFLLLAWTVLSASRTLAGPLQRPLRALGALGLASYSLYLIHPVITESAQPWLPDAGLARVASMLAMWAVAIGVSYTFYLVVERPFVSRSKRVGRAPALPLVASPVPAPASEHSSR